MGLHRRGAGGVRLDVVVTRLGWMGNRVHQAGAAAVQTGGNPTSDDGQQVALIDVSVFVTLVTLLTVWIVVQNRDIPTDGLRRRLTDGRGLLVGGRLSGTILYIAVIVIAMHIRTIFAVTTQLREIPAPSDLSVSSTMAPTWSATDSSR